MLKSIKSSIIYVLILITLFSFFLFSLFMIIFPHYKLLDSFYPSYSIVSGEFSQITLSTSDIYRISSVDDGRISFLKFIPNSVNKMKSPSNTKIIMYSNISVNVNSESNTGSYSCEIITVLFLDKYNCNLVIPSQSFLKFAN